MRNSLRAERKGDSIMVTDYWRMDTIQYHGSSPPQIVWSKFGVLKETPKGVWIICWTAKGSKKFILNGAKKRFAYPTKTEAKENFIARKKRYISILTAYLYDAKRDLSLGTREFIKAEPVELEFPVVVKWDSY